MGGDIMRAGNNPELHARILGCALQILNIRRAAGGQAHDAMALQGKDKTQLVPGKTCSSHPQTGARRGLAGTGWVRHR
ncbi:hypothetical protein MBENS4_3536 [Novosphingobium sp. MBES04]|nr:hypothetical protein MBENS4_3536 [Novosphingobium sp. MBES04]